MASFTKRDANRKRPRERHGHAGAGCSPEYISWMGMKARCYNTRARNYRWYGARGIHVCERWRNSFAAFLADMGTKPSPAHSLDRVDVDGDYEPLNCRWATWREQCDNKRPRQDFSTTPAGEAHGKAKLTAAAVLAIRFRRSGGESLKTLAAEYGVCEATISLAARGKNWARLKVAQDG